jgi:hypothetical protein
MNKTPQHFSKTIAENEVRLQMMFAFIALKNIEKKSKRNKCTVFSSLHSFLTHCANISKLLWSGKDRRGNYVGVHKMLDQDLADLLGLSAENFSLLKNKSFRNDLDHYDERLVEWIKQASQSSLPVCDCVIGTKNGEPTFYIRHYDPNTEIFTFMNRELDINAMKSELLELNKVINGIDLSSIL